jgi:hypothetical protein
MGKQFLVRVTGGPEVPSEAELALDLGEDVFAEVKAVNRKKHYFNTTYRDRYPYLSNILITIC